MKRYLFLGLLLLALGSSRGQDGRLDPTFNTTGLVTLHFMPDANWDSERGTTVLVQPDGKYLVLIRQEYSVLARYNADGSLDYSFGTGGFSDELQALDASTAVFQGSYIVVGGYTYDYATGHNAFALVRLDGNGKLDNTFGTDGLAIAAFTNSDAYLNALAVQDNGGIVAVGTGFYSYCEVVGEEQVCDYHNDFAIALFTAGGALDPVFNGGTATIDFGAYNDNAASAVALQSDGDIVVGGTTYNDDAAVSKDCFTLVRYLDNGALDPDFGVGGIVRTALGGNAGAYALAIQEDKKIIAAGSAYVDDGSGNGSNDIALLRYAENGSLDAGFGTGGVVTTDLGAQEAALAMAIGTNRITVVGSRYSSDPQTESETYQIVVARYLDDGINDGDPDGGFGTGGAVVTNLGGQEYASSLAVGSNGSVVICGGFYNFDAANNDVLLARYTNTGSLDATFNPRGAQPGLLFTYYALGATSDFNAVAVQPDGKVIAAGWAERYERASDGYMNYVALARFLADGTLDGSFGSGGITTIAVGGQFIYLNAMALQPDGKIVVGGARTVYDDSRELQSDFLLARFTGNGVADSTFDGDGVVITDFSGKQDYLGSLALQGDGKIVVAGVSFDEAVSVDEQNFFVVRYNVNGTLDSRFGSRGIATADFAGLQDQAYTVAIQSNGSIVVAGSASKGSPTTGYEYDFALARFTAAGRLDATFGTGGKVTTDFSGQDDEAYALAVQSNGNIVASGYATQDNNVGSTSRALALARYTPAGGLDVDFGTGGKVTTDCSGTLPVDADGTFVAVQADNKILVAGMQWTLDQSYYLPALIVARYSSAGVLDADFDGAGDGNGKVVLDFGSSAYMDRAVLANNRLYVAGYRYDDATNSDIGLLAALEESAGTQPPTVLLVTIDDVLDVPEGTTAAVTVRMNTTAHPDLTLSYATQDGTATSKGKTPDYKAARGTVTIPNGENTATINITTYTDAAVEPESETFTVNLSLRGKAPSGVTISDGSATVSIKDETGNGNRAVTVAERPTGPLTATVYPNPTSSFFTLQWHSGSTAPVTIQVTDASGRVVEAKAGVAANATLQLGHSYRPGVYYVEVQQGTAKQTLKVMKGAQ